MPRLRCIRLGRRSIADPARSRAWGPARMTEDKENSVQQTFVAENYTDKEGGPEGGFVSLDIPSGRILSIVWQNGPLMRGADRREPNGTFVETVIAAAVQRIQYYSASNTTTRPSSGAVRSLSLSHTSKRRSTGSKLARQTESSAESRALTPYEDLRAHLLLAARWA